MSPRLGRASQHFLATERRSSAWRVALSVQYSRLYCAMTTTRHAERAVPRHQRSHAIASPLPDGAPRTSSKYQPAGGRDAARSDRPVQSGRAIAPAPARRKPVHSAVLGPARAQLELAVGYGEIPASRDSRRPSLLLRRISPGVKLATTKSGLTRETSLSVLRTVWSERVSTDARRSATACAANRVLRDRPPCLVVVHLVAVLGEGRTGDQRGRAPARSALSGRAAKASASVPVVWKSIWGR